MQTNTSPLQSPLYIHYPPLLPLGDSAGLPHHRQKYDDTLFTFDKKNYPGVEIIDLR